MDRKDIFIEKARKTHGDKYDYSEVEYVDSQTKVCIICPEHGRFYQTPQAHVRGHQCPQCANIKRGDTFRSSKDDFIRKAKEIHGDKFDYSKVDYVNSNTKVCIICPEHGEFWQYPSQHVNAKQGCPKCASKGLTRDELIEKFRKVHGSKYNYDKVEFTGKMSEKVIITCPQHGDFLQSPTKHLTGRGCPKCGKESMSNKNTLTPKEFVEKAKKVHGNKYDYSKVDYRGSKEKIEIICPKHGSFFQLPFDHLDGHGCQKCGAIVSNDETEIYDFICMLIGKEKVALHDRSVLDGYEIDIYIPSKKVGIEYNGLYWHSEIFGKDKYYHLRKLEKCQEKGIKLIQIFEDEYKNNKGLIFEKISYILGLCSSNKRVMARKTEVKPISVDEAKEFLDKYHIQGYGKSTLSYGCFHQNRLISVMSFSKTGEKDVWLLTRYATKSGYICQGCAGKLFSHFIKEQNPKTVKSFADRRWTLSTDKNLYVSLGFELDGVLKPDYKYIKESTPRERIHKFNLRKKSLHRKYNLDMDLTESQMVKEVGYVKIWDCGLYRYVWKKKTTD